MNQIPDDIRDIQGPLPLPADFPWLPALVLAAVLLAAVIFFLRRRKIKPALPPPSAAEIALSELVRARALLKEETSREFAISVSEAVRRYIENRFSLRATRETTPEFLQSISANAPEVLTAYREPLQDFLRYCDLAKFARSPLAVGQMEQMLTSACSLVEQTKAGAER